MEAATDFGLILVAMRSGTAMGLDTSTSGGSFSGKKVSRMVA